VNRHFATNNGFEFSAEAIAQAAHHNRLLSMEIEFSQRCNFRCPYCYVPWKKKFKDELSLEEIRAVIMEAKALGAGKIIVLCGEPSNLPLHAGADQLHASQWPGGGDVHQRIGGFGRFGRAAIRAEGAGSTEDELA
jgi:hypothetical protein